MKRASLPLAMTLPTAQAIVGSPLGNPSKMPGRSYGLPAQACQRAQALDIEVCRKCYAKRGHYTAPNVKATQSRRLEAINNPQWVDAMVFLITIEGERWFRWHDSGDLQSVEHLAKICEVARRTSQTSHWLPTHEPGIVAEYRMSGGIVPDNLCIRLSADDIDSWPTVDTMGLPTSTVHPHRGFPVEPPDGDRKRSIECRAYTRENRCGQCRACWDRRVENVSYPAH